MLDSVQLDGSFQKRRMVHDADSLKTPGIWAADFVAGAFHHALKHNHSRYADALKPKFIANGYVKF